MIRINEIISCVHVRNDVHDHNAGGRGNGIHRADKVCDSRHDNNTLGQDDDNNIYAADSGLMHNKQVSGQQPLRVDVVAAVAMAAMVVRELQQSLLHAVLLLV